MSLKKMKLVPALFAVCLLMPNLSHAESSKAVNTKTEGDRASKIKMNEQMVETHQKMADCLKSDKSMEDCDSEMMKSCPMAKSGKNCSMMGMMGDQNMENMDHSKMMGKKKN